MIIIDLTIMFGFDIIVVEGERKTNENLLNNVTLLQQQSSRHLPRWRTDARETKTNRQIPSPQ